MQVQDFLELKAGEAPERRAVWHRGEWLTYGELDDLANRVGNWLCSRIARGDRVAFLIENSFFHLAVYFGILKAGGVAVAMNPLLNEEALKYQIGNSDTEVFITQGRAFRKLRGMVASCDSLRHIMVDGPVDSVEQSGAGEGQVLSFYEQVLAESSRERPPVRGIDLDLAEIVYTSGSTGVPKGVMLTHLNLVSNMKSIASYLGLTESDKIMVVLPFYYIYGKSLLLTHFHVGGEVLVDNRFMYPNKVLEAMEETGATGFAGVPSTFSILLNKSNLAGFDLPALRYVTQAGGAMAPAVQKEVVKQFSPAVLFVMYGATEAAPRLSYLEPELLERKWGSIGTPVDNVDLIISDGEGREVPPGETGEIAARGSNIMRGYWKDPEGTARVLRHGYYYTGDLGYRDEEGFIFITGRSKDIIKVKGYRVSAKEIEERILELDEVHETAVIAKRDEMMGEVPAAFVVFKEGCSLSVEEIRKFVGRKLATFKIPAAVLFRDNLPKNESGKIMKTQLSAD
ncbi:MAG: class I adenylate-forming enzyme family protein [Spirochaetales bacterium]|nr:class I adenylate-forming enzyme family protein [Spirochaetales bacterium]